MTTARQQVVYDFVRKHLDEKGRPPTFYEIGDYFRMTHVGAWRHVRALLDQGKLVRASDGSLAIPGRVDLSPVPTEALISELARRRAADHARPWR
jgi:SOS-response transcriptional repressor LexA